jgi:tetratricopeptide (TPR) repeat protein
VTLHFEPPVPGGVPKSTFPTARLIAPGVKFVNPIHNVAVTTKVFKAPGIIVEHRKGEQDSEARSERDAQRSDAVVNGLLAVLEKEPDNPRSWFYLGNQYKENGENEKAIKAYSLCLNISTWREERWQARQRKAFCHRNLGDLASARAEFSRALDELPTMAETHYALAALACGQGLFQEAAVWISRCLVMPIPTDTQLFLARRVYLIERYDLGSVIYSRLGDYKTALELAREAYKAEPSERIGKNIEIWEGKRV